MAVTNRNRCMARRQAVAAPSAGLLTASLDLLVGIQADLQTAQDLLARAPAADLAAGAGQLLKRTGELARAIQSRMSREE